MHELSLLEEVVRLVEVEARLHDAVAVATVCLQVGELSGVDRGALEFAFQAAVAGTVAEHSELRIESVPVIAYCECCVREFFPADFVYACPHCGQLSTDILQGTELILTSVELISND